MITISLCMIVKDEEASLRRCLQSVSDAVDEIIITDTGSSDNTKKIAAEFTGKIYDFIWTDDFSAARNFSYEKATMDYILWLDADDILLPEDALKLIRLKHELTPDINAVMLRYNTGFDKDGNVIFSFFRERLSKRSENYKWKEPVHEYLEVTGKRLTADISVTHAKIRTDTDNGRNIRIYEKLIANNIELSPRGMYYYARELKDHGRYSDAVTWFILFLDSKCGWLEDNIAACEALGECYLSLGKQTEAFSAFLQSFNFDTPRASICCRLGYYFKNQGNYKQAVFWFGLALTVKAPENNWGFSREDVRGYIPCIELSVCFEHLGRRELAVKFNEMAALYKPNSPAVAHNRSYFNNQKETRYVIT